MKRQDAEVFEQAADVLEVGGWRRESCGNIRDVEGSHCLLGALAAVLYIDGEIGLSRPLNLALRMALEFVVPLIGESCPATWNDRTGRTKYEVIDVLRKAAKGEEQ